MRKDQSSKTAEYMALFRALETVRPAAQRLFEDRFASGFLGWRYRLAVGLAHVQPVGNFLRAWIDRRWPGPRTAAAVRTRYIDEAVAQSIESGIEQVVLLGAGFDSRPYRIAGMHERNVFEVDHPATSAAKRKAISSMLGSVPSHVQFVPMDFDSESLANAMKLSGFNPKRRTLVLWEGVSNYLSRDAVDATLRWVAGLAPESRLIFTYVNQRLFDAPHAFDGTEKLFATLAAAGEKWTFGLDPADLRTYLMRRGLVLESDCGTVEARARYFGRDASGMSGYEFYRIAIARVAAS